MRKSPEEKAKSYNIGYQKTGLDGHEWKVTENKNGVKRWVAMGKTKLPNVKIEKGIVSESRLDEYPYYKLKMPSTKASLVKIVTKIAKEWEKLTGRDHNSKFIKENTLVELKKLFKTFTNKESAKFWVTY